MRKIKGIDVTTGNTVTICDYYNTGVYYEEMSFRQLWLKSLGKMRTKYFYILSEEHKNKIPLSYPEHFIIYKRVFEKKEDTNYITPQYKSFIKRIIEKIKDVFDYN